jgi:hypothetical protein
MTARDHHKHKDLDNDRREFLRKSVYAAYATPLITALLVAEESAAASRCSFEWCYDRDFHPRCCRDF